MTIEYKSRLPAALQSLVDEIETAAGVEIVVVRDASERTMCTNVAQPIAGGPSPTFIKIVCPADIDATNQGYPVPFAMFAHEPLHCRRYFVERAPAIWSIAGIPQYAADSQRAFGFPAPTQSNEMGLGMIFSAQGVETMLEHIVVEPRVKSYVPESPMAFAWRDFWTSMVPDRRLMNEQMVRWLYLYEWVVTQLLNSDADIQRSARKVLRGIDLLVDAEYLTHTLRWLADSFTPIEAKQAMCRVTCSILGIDPKGVRLLYGADLRPLPENFTVQHPAGMVYQYS